MQFTVKCIRERSKRKKYKIRSVLFSLFFSIPLQRPNFESSLSNARSEECRQAENRRVDLEEEEEGGVIYTDIGDGVIIQVLSIQ